jgi:hypothetical protein
MSAAQSGVCVVHTSAQSYGQVGGQMVWLVEPGSFQKDCDGKHETNEAEISLLEPGKRLL